MKKRYMIAKKLICTAGMLAGAGIAYAGIYQGNQRRNEVKPLVSTLEEADRLWEDYKKNTDVTSASRANKKLEQFCEKAEKENTDKGLAIICMQSGWPFQARTDELRKRIGDRTNNYMALFFVGIGICAASYLLYPRKREHVHAHTHTDLYR